MASRVESPIPPSRGDSWISSYQEQLPCSRCCAVIEYGRGTEWTVVNGLVNAHYEACPGKPHVRPVCMTRTPTSPSDTVIVLPPLVPLRQLCSAKPLVPESVGPQSNNTWISSGCERRRRTLEQRKFELEQDEYTKNVTAKSVRCTGCHKEISLDKRSSFYPGLWLKHKGKCPDIEKLERAKARAREEQNGVPIPISPDNSDGCHNISSKYRSIRYEDSEDPSSENGDEYEDPPPEPFPISNGKFYSLMRYDDSAEWVYRYATKDEIATNLFRGQDEPYTRRSVVLSNKFCEVSRCVIAKQFHIPTPPGGPSWC